MFKYDPNSVDFQCCDVDLRHAHHRTAGGAFEFRATLLVLELDQFGQFLNEPRLEDLM